MVIDAVLQDQSKASIKSVLGGKLNKNNILCIDDGNTLWGFVNEEDIPFKLIPPGSHIHEKNCIGLGFFGHIFGLTQAATSRVWR